MSELWGRRRLCAGRATLAAVAVEVAAIAAWLRTGSPWVWMVVVGVLVAGAVDLAWSWAALGSCKLRVQLPEDLTVGGTATVKVHVLGVRVPALVSMASVSRSDEALVLPGEPGALEIAIDRRGVFASARFTVRIGAPLHLVAVERSASVELPWLVHVAPAAVAWPSPTPVGAGPSAMNAAVAARDGTEVRSAREQVAGDTWRHVHWPATARSGRIMVRELERPAGQRVTVVVDLGPAPGPDAELVAGRAQWRCERLLAEGLAVELVTLEPDGPRRELVVDRRAVGRRLAAAVPGLLAAPAVPAGAPVPAIAIGPPP